MKWVLKNFEHTDSTPVELEKILEYSPVAAFWYARAFNCGHVNGPPVALLRVQLSEKAHKDGLVYDTLRGRPHQHTLGFSCPITAENYPYLKDYVVHYLSEEVGVLILQMGQDLVD